MRHIFFVKIAIQNISLQFGQRQILRNLSIEFQESAFVAIIGHNGAGKSSLFRLLSAQLKPQSGVIMVNDKPIESYSILEKAALLGVLPQLHPLAFPMLAEDLVAMGRFRFKSLLGNIDASDRSLGEDMLITLGAEKLIGRSMDTLSGGEQQMAWIAQLLLQDPSICLLDEPTQSLDVYNKKRIFQLMDKMVQQQKLVLCITHDLHYLKQMNGFVLNLSQQEPKLEKISPDLIQEHINFLENQVLL
jgi:iron complex transport system ATP-binding protein